LQEEKPTISRNTEDEEKSSLTKPENSSNNSNNPLKLVFYSLSSDRPFTQGSVTARDRNSKRSEEIENHVES